MLPEVVLQVTNLSVAEPDTFAEKKTVPPVVVVALTGEIVTPLTVAPGVGPFGVVGATTVTTAEANLVGSATLVAVTLPVVAVGGATKLPVALMLPIVVVQLTV
jgi:hypothetical protein